MPRMCKHQPAPTDEQRAAIAEVRANGGNLTADEMAHSSAFQRVGMSWTRARARRSIRDAQYAGRWEGAHCHEDGSIYLPRTP